MTKKKKQENELQYKIEQTNFLGRNDFEFVAKRSDK